MSWVDLAWPDRDGRLRFVSVPREGMAEAARAIRVDPARIGWSGLPGPLTVEPDSTGYRMSNGHGEVRLCHLIGPDGEPSPACGRSTLSRAVAAAARAGFSVIAAAEVEFHLTNGDGAAVYSEIENYGIVAGARYERVMRQVRGFRAAGIPVYATNPEYGGGQFEVNLVHGPVLEAADAVTLLRAWTGAVAAREGFRATFAAKPWPDASGSGLHVHQSLWRNGENAFWRDGGGLSEPGRSYLAGLLDALPELAPLGSPTPLAYTRRSDGSFCPTTVCWGGDNRTVAVRALADEPAATRIEQRDAAADANPHLVMAGQILAGLRGVFGEAEPPDPVEGDAYARTDLPRLPRSLPEALPLFEASGLARVVLGDEAHAILCSHLGALVEAELAGVGAGPDPGGAW